MIEKLVVFDIAESGIQIGKKLFALLNKEQQRELSCYVQTKAKSFEMLSVNTSSSSVRKTHSDPQLTEIQIGELYFCLENRIVRIDKKDVRLTGKEFEIFTLLITNPSRVFTYEMIADSVWNEMYDYSFRKAINNHIYNLRRKLKVSPQTPEYIMSVHGIGYRFSTDINIP